MSCVRATHTHTLHFQTYHVTAINAFVAAFQFEKVREKCFLHSMKNFSINDAKRYILRANTVE